MQILSKKPLVGIVIALSLGLVVFSSVAQGFGAGASGAAIPATSRLDSLPMARALPAGVAQKVAQLAGMTDAQPTAAAEQSVRLARSDTGKIGTDIYVFKSGAGRPCVVVPDLTGFCEPDSGIGSLGIDWSLGGGDSATPSRFVAVVPDDIAAITLAVDGADIPVSVTNNMAYAEFPATSKQAVISVRNAAGVINAKSMRLTG